jgi:DNA-binding Lrp family transcriptional regulator
MSVTDVAARVRLSLSSCHRRVRDLERSGAIQGYRAVVDPAAVGLEFESILFVSLARHDRASVAEFEAAVDALPAVVEAERLFGEPDYLLRVLTRDLASYQELYDVSLASMPSVQRLTSTLVMKRIGGSRTVPLG